MDEVHETEDKKYIISEPYIGLLNEAYTKLVFTVAEVWLHSADDKTWCIHVEIKSKYNSIPFECAAVFKVKFNSIDEMQVLVPWEVGKRLPLLSEQIFASMPVEGNA